MKLSRQKLTMHGFGHVLVPLIIVVGIGLFGTYYLVLSHAGTATPKTTGLLASGLTNSAGKVLCLNDKGDIGTNGALITISQCSETTAGQQWTLYSDNSIRIKGKCLDILHASQANGAKVEIYTCKSGSNSQRWMVGTNPRLSLNNLMSSASGKCLDVDGGQTANGTAANLYACNGTAAQVWGWAPKGTAISPGGTTGNANCVYIGGNDEGSCYVWVGAAQNNNNKFTASGASADFSQANPTCNKACGHTIVEFMTSNSTGKNTIEYGWGVQSNSGKPTLGIGLYANGSALNADANFVQVSKTIKIGQAVKAGTTAAYKIQYVSSSKQWQLLYNGTEVGYFPESIWTSRKTSYTQIGWLEIFGEAVQPYTTVARMQMGDGTLGSQPGAVTVSNYALTNSSTPAELTGFFNITNPKYYDYGSTSSTGFSYGGPGIF